MGADITMQALATKAAPLDYPIPAAVELLIKSLKASFDGTSAAGPWVPSVQLITAGLEDATYPLGQALPVGATADVTWFPGVGGGSTGLLSRVFHLVLGADEANFDATNLPQSYSALLMMANLRTDGAGTTQNCAFTINGNASVTTYSYHDSSGTNNQSAVAGKLCISTAAGADAGHYGTSVVYLHDYSQAINDHALTGVSGAIAVEANNATWFAIDVTLEACQAAVAAISRITIAPDVGTVWKAGSSLTIYGLP